MNSRELNTAAIEAKTNTTKIWDIKAHYMPLIERLAQDNWYKIDNETHFIDDCYRKIEYAVRTFDIELGDFDGRAMTYIYQSLRQYCGNHGGRRKVLQLGADLVSCKTQDNAVNVEEEALGNASGLYNAKGNSEA